MRSLQPCLQPTQPSWITTALIGPAAHSLWSCRWRGSDFYFWFRHEKNNAGARFRASALVVIFFSTTYLHIHGDFKPSLAWQDYHTCTYMGTRQQRYTNNLVGENAECATCPWRVEDTVHWFPTNKHNADCQWLIVTIRDPISHGEINTAVLEPISNHSQVFIVFVWVTRQRTNLLFRGSFQDFFRCSSLSLLSFQPTTTNSLP